MIEITSVNNDMVREAVKLQQRKYRDKTRRFLLEGNKPIVEAFQAGVEIETVFVEKDKIARYSFLKEKVVATSEAVLKKIATTTSAPEAVGIARQKKYDVSDLKNCRKVVLLEGIKDVGNLGTILRTSVAFGVEAVILYGECVDLYNPKCVRASVGNLWKIPVVEVDDFKALEGIFSNFQRVATLPRATTYLKDFQPADKVLVMFGSEADGLSEKLVGYANSEVKIEMSPQVESLNLSISCAVILYKIFAK